MAIVCPHLRTNLHENQLSRSEVFKTACERADMKTRVSVVGQGT